MYMFSMFFYIGVIPIGFMFPIGHHTVDNRPNDDLNRPCRRTIRDVRPTLSHALELEDAA